jgi:hypothetical protein
MKTLHNEKGIALVTSLMFTALCLVITMALLYMVTAGSRSSGALKRYRTVTEAAYGGTDIVLKDLISASFAYKQYSAQYPGGFNNYMKNTYMASLNSADVSSCLRTKLESPKSTWPANCQNVTSPINNNWDIKFQLTAASGTTPFTVYSRIVDDMGYKLSVFENHSAKVKTIAGNSTVSLYSLEGTSVTEASGVTVPHYPYMYRMEIQAERPNSSEKSKISVQYAY